MLSLHIINFLQESLRKPTALPNDTNIYFFFSVSEIGLEFSKCLRKQIHQVRHLLLTSVPILGRKGIDGELDDTKLSTPFCNLF